ncbi:MAG: BlaB/IND/MUS family subclass B1 metallo-beta-lactamase [Saprospiraceae bacterium]
MKQISSILLALVFITSIHSQSDNLNISHLTGDFYVYTTYNLYKGNRIPANGVYLVTHAGVVMIDTPWDTTQFQPILDSIWARHHTKVVTCISTHFHEDRTGGLEYYRKQGISTYTTELTDEFSQHRGMKRAEFLISKDTTFTIGDHSFETYFPGPGHAPDNIVIWFPTEKILYGGCLIKSVNDTNLGNLADANQSEYANSIERVQRKCKRPKWVIPGHGEWKSMKSVKHTLKMARLLRKGD